MKLGKFDFSNIFNDIKGVVADLVDDFEPITNDEKRDLYKQYRSFSGFLPYSEFLTEHDLLLLEDHVSVAAMWEIEPVRSEGVDVSYIDTIESQIADATAGILEQSAMSGQYVLSAYTQDEFSLEEEYLMLKNSIHERWEGSALANAYLKSMERMLHGMESEAGLFKETMRKGGDDSDAAMRPYRGGKRRHRIMLYRRVKLKDRRGKESVREDEIKAMKNMRGVIETALGQFASVKRMNKSDFYNFMVRFLNHKPVATNGDVNRLIRENPCPSDELAGLDGEYALSMMHSKVETKAAEGVVEFDGHPARFLQIERLNSVPEPGVLTAEKQNEQNGEVTTAFDKFPNGSIFVQHIVFEDNDEQGDRIRLLEKKSRHADDDAIFTNEECKASLYKMAKGKRLYKTEMGVYLFADNMKELDSKTELTKVLLANDLKLKAISPQSNLFPIESFLRNLPFVYDPFLDARRKRGRTTWYHHGIRFLPIMGRTRGNISRTNSVCSVNFNRRGEMILFDPLDYDGNAHMTLLGPSGLGKSATLNKTIVELLLFKNARIFLAEAGMSFDPLMDFLDAEGMDVQRVNIGVDSNSKPVAPFGNAKKARDDFVQFAVDDTKYNEYIDSMITELTNSGLVFSENISDDSENISDDSETRMSQLGFKISATTERIIQSFDDAQGESSDDKKDYMGECIMIAKIMVTGGDQKEEAKFNLQDVKFLTDAMIHAANLADFDKEDLVRPSHVVRSLRVLSEKYEVKNSDAYKRLQAMADTMSLYTTSLRGKVLDQKAAPFRNCDCLHVELGLAQRDANKDLLALAYLSLMNMINDVAERKASVNDSRPIYVITDEAHLILKDPIIAPIAVKIVRMWRKYGAWFLPATQDIANSFTGEASAILQICEYFIALKPPPDDLDALAVLARLKDTDKALITSARAEKYKYTEGVIINKTRGESSLIRIIQPSFTLAIAGTEDKEKNERTEISNQYGTRTAGSTLIQAEIMDNKRGIISEEEMHRGIKLIADNPKFRKTSH
ncbi:MAG: conjugative transfer ATPase [Cocleimonas sp.]